MAIIGNIEQFDTTQCDFETYMERFTQLVSVNKIETTMKLAFFLTMIGAEAYNVLKSLCTPDTPKDKTYEQCVTIEQV